MNGRTDLVRPALIAALIAMALFLTENTVRLLSPLSSPWLTGLWAGAQISASLAMNQIFTGDPVPIWWRNTLALLLYAGVLPAAAITLARKVKNPAAQTSAQVILLVLALLAGAYGWKAGADTLRSREIRATNQLRHELLLTASAEAVRLSREAILCACVDRLQASDGTAAVRFELVPESESAALLTATRTDGAVEPVRYRIVTDGPPLRADSPGTARR
jgi:hypothetical protein